jgi:hypothetical protein
MYQISNITANITLFFLYLTLTTIFIYMHIQDDVLCANLNKSFVLFFLILFIKHSTDTSTVNRECAMCHLKLWIVPRYIWWIWINMYLYFLDTLITTWQSTDNNHAYIQINNARDSWCEQDCILVRILLTTSMSLFVFFSNMWHYPAKWSFVYNNSFQ